VSRALAWGGASVAVAVAGSRAPGVPGGLPDAVAAPIARWDALHLHAIATGGYPSAPGAQWAFFPGFPLLSRAAGGGWVAGALLSTACLLLALVALHRLTALDLGERVARRTVWLTALFPASLFGSAYYSEGLFLALTVGCVLAARRDRWAAAGVLGGAAALTRSTGVLLLLPLAALAWRRRARPAQAAWLALVPAGLGAFLLYAGVRTGDALAPWHAQRTWGRAFHGPLSAIPYALGDARSALGHAFSAAAPGQFEPPWMKLALIAALGWALVATAGALRRLPAGYGLYALAALAVPLSSPWPDHPLMSLVRFLAVLFPLQMWQATRRRGFVAAVVVSAVGLVVLSARFGTWAWAA